MYFVRYKLQYYAVYQEVPFVAIVASQALLVLLINLYCSLLQDLYLLYETKKIKLQD